MVLVFGVIQGIRSLAFDKSEEEKEIEKATEKIEKKFKLEKLLRKIKRLEARKWIG